MIIKMLNSLRKVLNFHTCFMSRSESKAKLATAKRIDKHSISNGGIVEQFAF